MKSERENQILYSSVYICGIEKNGTDEPICGAGIETQKEDGFADIVREWEGGN